jgi:hypothetical protein
MQRRVSGDHDGDRLARLRGKGREGWSVGEYSWVDNSGRTWNERISGGLVFASEDRWMTGS